MNPRTELEARYPEADFSVYFRFLDACRGTEKSLDTHEHHICPRAQFPEFVNVAENFITLRTDDHAFAHALLSAVHPDFKALPAALLAAQVACASRAGKLGGKAAQATLKKNKSGIYGLTLEQRRENGRRGGSKAGAWKGHVKKVRGVAGAHLTREHQAAAGRKAAGAGARLFNHKRWHVARNMKSAACALCYPTHASVENLIHEATTKAS